MTSANDPKPLTDAEILLLKQDYEEDGLTHAEARSYLTICAQAVEIERGRKIEKAARALLRNAPDVSEDELRSNRVALSWTGNGQGVFDLRAALTTTTGGE